ncbi:hypothetical protein G7067_12345 [Leucobacter insecticola]|uniref:Uncharacterized protein n=1 Tax=Leucobacter insecticola TaxID=2714934 RepID=A0A6G8FKX2_9MICO|nr:hypothetical protein [Leucobacter insecticola]QIM17017.1 hypothetical protein G7067_12345 [Leucobacter insecticola]
MKSIRRTSAVVAAIALALPLAACSGGQSVEAACNVANATVNEAQSDAQKAMSELGAGDTDLSKLFDPINAAFDKATSKVTNVEVSDALGKVAGEFKAFSDELADYKFPDMSDIDYSDPASLSKLEDMQKEAEALAENLQGRQESMQKSLDEWNKLCPAS